VAQSSTATTKGDEPAPLSAPPPELPNPALDIAGGDRDGGSGFDGWLEMGSADPTSGWLDPSATDVEGVDPTM
jgi:hypothetical protein